MSEGWLTVSYIIILFSVGGLHSLLAKIQLNELHPENPYYKVALAEVYVNLTDEQALRLAQRHNQNSHFVHRVTHRNLVS